jgi:hypothetical protein
MEFQFSSYDGLKHSIFMGLDLYLINSFNEQQDEFQFCIGKLLHISSSLSDDHFTFQAPDIPSNLKFLSIKSGPCFPNPACDHT